LKISSYLIAGILLSACIASCSNAKKAVDEYRYFDKHLDTLNSLVTELKEPLIHEGDLLNITIMSATLNQEQVAVFNLVKDEGDGGYLVDPSGSINMPVLGKLKVDGLSKSELEKQLLQKLEPFVKNPVVTISFLNFRVLLLGEVSRTGFQVVVNEKATVLDAIGQAGGLTDYGQRTNILLIRQLPGGQKEYARLNINDARIFASPYFQLQQNDVIYVMPNDSKMIVYQRSNSPFFRDLPVYLSLITSIIAFATIIIALTK
jgi:polysaccharide export outer membrane protein